MEAPGYINWFVRENYVCLEDGVPITCYKLDYCVDEDTFRNWALHIRRHYESDDELIESLSDTQMSAEEYLRRFVIPQKNDIMAGTSRSNDFTEIMISDLLEFIHGFTVPRCKQENRSGKTQSEHGTDIIGYKFKNSDHKPSDRDELLAVEVKAGLSSDNYFPICKAVADSHKYDEVRHSHTLNFYRKKLRSNNQCQKADDIARFQRKSENDYIITFVAAAIISREVIDDNIIVGIKGVDLELRENDKIFLVHGNDLMNLAHEIYERCIE